MIKKTTMRNSSLYIFISGKESELGDKAKEKMEHTFKSLFSELATKVSDERDKVEQVIEIVYEIKTPIIQDESLVKEFFENLEILLDELSEFNPHFTQFRRVND